MPAMHLTPPRDTESLPLAKGLVVVVTGGSSNIGRAIITSLHAAGAKRIYILARRIAPLDYLAQTLNEESAKSTVIPLQCDVTSTASILLVIDRIERETGYVDVLINNASIDGPNHQAVYQAGTIKQLQSVLLSGLEGWESSFAVNSSAVAIVSTAFLGLLDAANKRRGWENDIPVNGRARRRDTSALERDVDPTDLRTSQIITISSISGLDRHLTFGFPYSSSKAAAIHIAKTLSTLLAPWGIRSNVIAPGSYASEFTARMPHSVPSKSTRSGQSNRFEDVAELVLNLVGRDGASITGGIQLGDGGRLGLYPITC